MVLPDMDGEQVIFEMRAHPEWKGIPIVVVSGQDETMLKATATGPLCWHAVTAWRRLSYCGGYESWLEDQGGKAGSP